MKLFSNRKILLSIQIFLLCIALINTSDRTRSKSHARKRRVDEITEETLKDVIPNTIPESVPTPEKLQELLEGHTFITDVNDPSQAKPDILDRIDSFHHAFIIYKMPSQDNKILRSVLDLRK